MQEMPCWCETCISHTEDGRHAPNRSRFDTPTRIGTAPAARGEQETRHFAPRDEIRARIPSWNARRIGSPAGGLRDRSCDNYATPVLRPGPPDQREHHPLGDRDAGFDAYHAAG